MLFVVFDGVDMFFDMDCMLLEVCWDLMLFGIVVIKYYVYDVFDCVFCKFVMFGIDDDVVLELFCWVVFYEDLCVEYLYGLL